MGFREMVSRDLAAVFINPAELAEVHLLDGRPVLLVEEEDEERARRFGSKAEEMWMLGNLGVTLYIQEAVREEAGLPVFYAGQRILYDNELVGVAEAVRTNGLWRVLLEASTSYGGG